MNPTPRHTHLSIRTAGNTLIIQDLKADREFTLNEVESLLWQLLDGQRSVEILTRILTQEYNFNVGREDVWKMLDKFSDFNLLSQRLNPPASQPDGYPSMTRRKFSKIVRQISLGAAGVAISVAMPNLATAQSSEQISKEQQSKQSAEQSSKEQRSKQSSEQSSKEQRSKQSAEQSSKEQQSKQSAEQSSKEQSAKRR